MILKDYQDAVGKKQLFETNFGNINLDSYNTKFPKTIVSLWRTCPQEVSWAWAKAYAPRHPTQHFHNGEESYTAQRPKPEGCVCEPLCVYLVG